MPQKISALPVKAKVRDAKTKYYGIPIGWEIGDKNHAGYPANSTTLVAESIIKICCFDAMESDGILDRERYGNNRYSLANIRQWLNKSGTGWYQAQHSYDRPPSNSYVWNGHNAYDAQSGFLTGFGAEMLAALLTTTLTVAKPGTDGGGSETVQDKIFLLSMAEVGLGSENGVAEGTKLAMFSDNASRQCKPTAQAVSNGEYTNSSLSASQFWYWWLRSPYSSYASHVRCVSQTAPGLFSRRPSTQGQKPARARRSVVLPMPEAPLTTVRRPGSAPRRRSSRSGSPVFERTRPQAATRSPCLTQLPGRGALRAASKPASRSTVADHSAMSR